MGKRTRSGSNQNRERRATASRLPVLAALLIVAGGAFLGTRSWRQRLMEESAKSRAVIASVESATRAHVAQQAQETQLERRLRDTPADLDARLELVRLRWQSRGPSAAAALLEAAPDALATPLIARMLAAAQRLMRREDRALATLDRAIDDSPADGDLRTERATLLSLLGFFAEAEADLQAAARLKAEPVPLALARATLARQQNDRRGARRELEAARRLAPDDVEVTKQLAAVLESEDRFGDAARLLEAVAESENEPETWTALGRVLLRSRAGDATARAKASAERALAVRPGMPAARLLLARCRRRDGDAAGALELLEPLAREHPRRPGVAHELAQIYKTMGRSTEAGAMLARHEAWLRRRSEMRRAALALMSRPRDAVLLREMGRLCLDRGMVGRAILYLERARRRDPRLSDVTPLLDRAHREPVRTEVGDE